jgi:hypothetical protein
VLRSLGVTVDSWPVLPVVLAVGASAHVVPDAGYSIVASNELRNTLRQHAVGLGAQYVRDSAGANETHVVLAGGSAYAQGQAPHSSGLTCARRFTGPALAKRVVVRLLAPAADDPRGRPRCAWLAPTPDGCTVGASALGELDVDALLERAFEALIDLEPLLVEFRPAGPISSGMLHSGFSPDTAGAGLLAGDAAGLVNPFTGEGVSNAVQSGQLAAQAILAHLDDPAAARREYGRLLGSAFVGYFETARHAARRYHLAWRVLAAGAGSESPFFTKGRRAIVLPEGVSALAAAQPVDLPVEVKPLLLPFLAVCDEVAVTTIRNEWPFLARMVGAHRDHVHLRPAIGFFAAILAGGRPPERGHATVAAAIELATLGALAFLGPAVTPREVRGVDWESATTVLAGDYLLGQASRLIAEAAPDVSWAFSGWLAELAALRATAVTSGQGADAVFAALFEFPLRIGADLGGAPVEPLRTYGEALGRAFLHAEDVLAVRGVRTRLDAPLTDLLAGRISALPTLLAMPELTASALKEPGLKGDALAAATGAGGRAIASAMRALHAIEQPMARALLHSLADFVGTPM